MRVSTRGRYALRIMVDVALHTDEGPVPRRDIAARQELSADYGAQLCRRLREAGLIRGVKGPGGGYTLARNAATIRVGDVMRAVEGPISVVHCTDSSDEPSCTRLDRCVDHVLWEGLSQVMADFLDSVTLKDLRNHAQQMAEDARQEEGPNPYVSRKNNDRDETQETTVRGSAQLETVVEDQDLDVLTGKRNR